MKLRKEVTLAKAAGKLIWHPKADPNEVIPICKKILYLQFIIIKKPSKLDSKYKLKKVYFHCSYFISMYAVIALYLLCR